MKMSIECKSTEEFYDAISAMVQRGLTFNANSETLIIELTGGY